MGGENKTQAGPKGGLLIFFSSFSLFLFLNCRSNHKVSPFMIFPPSLVCTVIFPSFFPPLSSYPIFLRSPLPWTCLIHTPLLSHPSKICLFSSLFSFSPLFNPSFSLPFSSTFLFFNSDFPFLTLPSFLFLYLQAFSSSQYNPSLLCTCFHSSVTCFQPLPPYPLILVCHLVLILKLPI